MPKRGLQTVIAMYSYVKIFIVLFFLVLLPDFVLSLSGRDTYLFYRYPLLVDIGIIVAIITGAIFLLEVAILFKNKQLLAIFFFSGGLFLCLLCKLSIGVLAEKSASEARLEVESFLMNKGLGGSEIVKIEDEVATFYSKYLTADFSKEDLVLMWKSPQFGKYEFKVSSPNTQPFLIRLSTLQNESNKIWIHREGTGSNLD
jgi:hypothetical protein